MTQRGGTTAEEQTGEAGASAPTPTERLARQPSGRVLKIVGFDLPAEVHQRLLELGVTQGAECTVVRYAPLGDPMQVRVRGYSLSLRREEADGVLVQPVY